MNKDKNDDRRYFDLEDEDNVAMADQAAEGNEDEYFIKFTVGSSLTNRFQTEEKLSESLNQNQEEEKKQISTKEAECEPEPTLVSREGMITSHKRVAEES